MVYFDQVKNGRLSDVHGMSEELGDFRLIFPKSSKESAKFNHMVTYANDLKQLKDHVMQGFSLQNWDKGKV